jgi:hypothetical protein
MRIVFMQLFTIISTIDDLNYPEKTNTYYIVNAPYIFSACWKVSLNIVDHYDYISCFAILPVSLFSDLQNIYKIRPFWHGKSVTLELLTGRQASIAGENQEKSSGLAR